MLVVGERAPVADVAERREEHRRVAVLLERGQRVLEVVAVAVVERDQDGLRRQRGAVDVVGEHGVEPDDRVAELGEQRHLLRRNGSSAR